MKRTNLVLLVLGALALFGALGFWWLDRPALPESGAAGTVLGASLDEGDAGAAPLATQDCAPERRTRSEVAPQQAGRASDEPALYPAKRGFAALFGSVVDDKGLPVGGAEVTVSSTPGRAPLGLRIVDDRRLLRRVVTGPDGRFAWRDLPEGPCLLRATDTRKREALASVVITATTPTPRKRLVLVEAAALDRDFVVKVVDAEDRPVEGAVVEVTGGLRGQRVVGQDGVPALSQRSDPLGKAVFANTVWTGVVVIAHGKEGRVGMAAAFGVDGVRETQAQGGLVVKLLEPGRLQGALTGVDKSLVEGCTVSAWAMNTNGGCSLLSYGVRRDTKVRGGRYAFTDLPAGAHTLVLEGETGVRLVLPPWKEGDDAHANSVQPLVVQVEAGKDTNQDLPCTLGGMLTGTVRDETGAPLAGAELVATYGPKDTRFIDTVTWRGLPVQHLNHEDPLGFSAHPQTHPRVRTRADGTYSFAGLQPGEHRVEVRANRRAVVRRMGVVVKDATTVTADFVLVPAGVLQGVADADHLVVLRKVEELTPCLAARVPDEGEFTLPGVAAGRYAVGIAGADGEPDLLELTEVTVEAGRTTFVDLLAFGVEGLQGRVLVGAGPLAGARVAFGSRSVATDEQGRFALRLPTRLVGEAWLQVEVGQMRWNLLIPERPAASAAWPGELRLGPHRVEFRTERSDALPVAATISLTGEVAGRDPFVKANLVDATLRSDASGAAVAEELLPGRYRAVAEFANGATQDLVFEVPTLAPVVLREPPVGEVSVVVRDQNGHPLAGVEVELESFAARTARLTPAPVPMPPPEAPVAAEDAAQGAVEEKSREASGVALLQEARAIRELVIGSFPTWGNRPQVDGFPRLRRTADGKSFIFEVAPDDQHGTRLTTDAEGHVLFRALEPGDYCVRLPPPRAVSEDPAKRASWPAEDSTTRVLARQRSEVQRVLRR